MHRILYCIVVLPLLLGAGGIHIHKVSGPVKDVGKMEIVVEKMTPVLRFTADEVKRILKTSTGKNIPIVRKPSGKAFAILLGDNSFARKAGIHVEKLPEEGYVMLRKGNLLFIAGLDDPRKSPLGNQYNQAYNRNTLNGVYDFFERFAGCGFFFPGPYGTVIPRKKGLFLPEKLEVRESPDMKMRTFYLGRNQWHENVKGYYGGVRGYNMNCLYHRLSHSYYPFGHGLSSLNLVERFGKSHPEYFALMKDGKRFCDPGMSFTGQICYHSKIKEEITADAIAFFRGRNASERGMKQWNPNGRYGRYFSVMAQDWFFWCCCSRCSRIAEGGRDKIYKDRKHNQAVSNFIWKYTSDIANAVKKAGVKGFITQMAYRPYDRIPDCTVPDNVKVMVAVNSNGDNSPKDRADTLLVKRWADKLGQKVMLWTYAIGKFAPKNVAGIPPVLGKRIVHLIERNKECVDGIFWEAETENSFLQFFNIYVGSRKMWNTSLCGESIIDNHHRLLFGKGAPFLKKFYEELEELYYKRILTHTIDTGLGPVTQVPGDLEIWTKIYSPARIRHFDALFNQAKRAAASDKEAQGRIEYVRKHLLGPLKQASEKFNGFQNALDTWNVSVPGSVYLRAYKGERNEVETKVTLSRDQDHFYFLFDCEEPRMKDLKAVQTAKDAKLLYADSTVEILLNPSGDRKNYLQYIINTNGAIADYKLCRNAKSPGIAWNGNATARVEKKSDRFRIMVTIPQKDLGQFGKSLPVNFARHRALNGKKPLEIYYQWSPLSGGKTGFHEVERWGRILLEKEPAAGKTKLLKYEDFSGNKLPHNWQTKRPHQKVSFDHRVFISGGKSLYMKNVDGGLMGATIGKFPGIKPGKKYRISYFLKTNNIKGSRGAGAYISFSKGKGWSLPGHSVTGTTPWHRLNFEFTAPAHTGKDMVPSFSFWIWKGEGEAYFDEVRIEELP